MTNQHLSAETLRAEAERLLAEIAATVAQCATDRAEAPVPCDLCQERLADAAMIQKLLAALAAVSVPGKEPKEDKPTARVDAMGDGHDSPTAAGNVVLRVTEYEADVIHDALSEAEGEAERQREMWEGRSREKRYRRERDEAAALRAKLQAQEKALALPAPPEGL